MTIGVAVIGAGMAGRAHAAAFRVAPTLYEPTLPPLRYVSIADVNAELGGLAAKRFGYERSDCSWREVAADPDIDVVAVAVANSLHREIVEGLIDAGKHVLCEKPMSDSLPDARAMAEKARAAATTTRIGFTYLRAPGVAAIRDLIAGGKLGRVLHVDVRYWADYAADPSVPISWRYLGDPGSGALADVGSHAAYLAEFLAGSALEVSGAVLTTAITERPVAAGAVIGHDKPELTDRFEAVENDDYAAFSARFAEAPGTLQVSRVAAGHPNGLLLEVFAERGAAKWSQERASEFELVLAEDRLGQSGFRRVNIGETHPYVAGGQPISGRGVGMGQNECFYVQARAFLEEVAGFDEDCSLPRCPSFDAGVHNMEFLAAVAESAARGGSSVNVPHA